MCSRPDRTVESGHRWPTTCTGSGRGTHGTNPAAELQESYRQAVDAWLTAIRAEEALTGTNPTVAQVDLWEGAHFTEEIARHKAKQAEGLSEGASIQTRGYTALPTSAPTPAVTAIASTPQNVTRKAPRSTGAPPADAASAPRIIRKTTDVAVITGISKCGGASADTIPALWRRWRNWQQTSMPLELDAP